MSLYLNKYPFVENKNKNESSDQASTSSAKPSIKSHVAQQPTILNAFDTIKQWDINSAKSQQIHNLIGEMISVDIQPFSMVNDTGFKRLMNKILPHYKIPSDKYFREKIVPDISERCIKAIQNKLDKLGENNKISMTSDIWTCQHTNNSFIYRLQRTGLILPNRQGEHRLSLLANILWARIQEQQFQRH